MSQTRTDLISAMTTRHQSLGYQLNATEIEAVVNDIQKVIVNDQATAIADCVADIAAFPQDPQIPGG